MTHEDWISAYGSLMCGDPGFLSSKAQRALLVGYRRCFSVFSIHHRGTRARPGLVLGLDRGGACTGMAFRVAPEDAEGVRMYLRGAASKWKRVPQHPRACDAGRGAPRGDGVGVCRRTSHVNYAGRLPVATQARVIAAAAGRISGANIDYLANTLAHLRAMGLRSGSWNGCTRWSARLRTPGQAALRAWTIRGALQQALRRKLRWCRRGRQKGGAALPLSAAVFVRVRTRPPWRTTLSVAATRRPAALAHPAAFYTVQAERIAARAGTPSRAPHLGRRCAGVRRRRWPVGKIWCFSTTGTWRHARLDARSLRRQGCCTIRIRQKSCAPHMRSR